MQTQGQIDLRPILDMLLKADPKFRNSFLYRLRSGDPATADLLKRAVEDELKARKVKRK